ncbi:MAG: methyltransferase domain-containing protein, partial [Clostridia bacterium]|nr:methyltransferase domain-containing protein [Clostridia bacterium]
MSVRMRKKKNIVPRLEAVSSLMVDDPAALKGKWREFLKCDKLMLEIGCGKGKFTLGTAMENPDRELIALERVSEAIVMAAEKAMAEGVTNVRYVIGDAANLAEFFAPGELDRIYINFCDPWVKKKHAKRR